MVTIDGKKTIHFGALGYSDFPTHKDEKRKSNYISRHRKKEDWTDVYTAGFWARWILWNKSNFTDSIKDTEKRFNIKIDY